MLFTQSTKRLIFILTICLWSSLDAYHFHITPTTSMVGRPLTTVVDKNFNIHAIARQFDVGLDNLLAANTLQNNQRLKIGRTLIIPSQYILPPLQHKGIIVNLAEKRLYYYPNQNEVYVYPVAVGALGRDSPIQSFYIRNKRENPDWIVPKQSKEDYLKAGYKLPDIVPHGPDNPLGKHAMRLSFTSFLIHGTNHPNIIGTRASSGCLSMYPEDIAELFAMTPEKTKVTIINTPIKWAKINKQLFVEVHQSHQETPWTPPQPLPRATHLLTRMGIPDKERPSKTIKSLNDILTQTSTIPTPIDWPYNQWL